MDMFFKGIKTLGIVFMTLFFLLLFSINYNFQASSPPVTKFEEANNESVVPFTINNSEINIINTKAIDKSSELRKVVLQKAKEMAEVKWTPQYNIKDKYCNFVFARGATYTGVPYSMNSYQVISASDFLSKINASKTLYGNDCSGFVSAVWDIGRQTTLSFYNAVKNGNKIEDTTVIPVAWDSLKPGDAILRESGTGKGHIVLYVGKDSKNEDNIVVYEQNIPTKTPYVPLPVVREDVRSKKLMIKEGYFPIRLLRLDG